MVPTGGTRSRSARPPRHRASARFREPRRRLALSGHGRPAGSQRARVDAHDDDPLVGRMVDGRPDARGPRARPRARGHSRGHEAVERHARPRVDEPRARARSSSTSASRGYAAEYTPRPAPRRIARARARDALGRRHRRVGRAGADSKGGHARRSADGHLRARLHHVPRAHGQRGLRRQRARRAARAQAHPRPAARATRGRAAGGRARTCSGSSPSGPGTASIWPRTRGARGRSFDRREGAMSLEDSVDARAPCSARGRAVAAARRSRRACCAPAVADDRARRGARELLRHGRRRGLGPRHAAARRDDRRGRRRQEPPRRVAVRAGPRARPDDPAPRPLRPHRDAARRHHGRDQRALRPRGRRPLRRRADAHEPVGGREGGRRRPQLGRGDGGVAPPEPSRDPQPDRADRKAVRPRQPRAPLRGHPQDPRAHRPRPSRSPMVRRPPPSLAQHLRDHRRLRRDAPEAPRPAS